MPQFNIGSKVIQITTGEHGIVIEVMQARRGRQLYKIEWSNGSVNDEFEVNLAPDSDTSDPFERCENGIFGTYSDYAKKNTTFKIKSSNDSTISSLKASKTLFRAYQFKPLLKFLNSPTRRLLIADEVGLGKTIEAGHIMLEMKARGELKGVLIICPKSLQVKWREELKEKFGLIFKIYDSAKELITDLTDHPYSVQAIINYEKTRYKEEKDEEEEDGIISPKKKKKRSKDADAEAAEQMVEIDTISKYFMYNRAPISLVLCDEAHKLRNRETQTYKGVEPIVTCASSAVFLTATPVMISNENLYNLLHLLDSKRYRNPDIFYNMLNQNSPFVRAITSLNRNVPLTQIGSELFSTIIHTRYVSADEEFYYREATIDELFADDPVYQEIKQRLSEEDTAANRARLQYLLTSMSVMNNIFSRTRKREVTTDLSQAERKPHRIFVDLHPEERAEYDKIINDYTEDKSYTNEWGAESLTQGAALGLVQKKRQIASSVYGYLNSENSLADGKDAYADCPDAKVEKLLEVIEEVFRSGTKKLVIFALFRRTLYYLKLRLKKKNYNCLMIHGLIENRAEILDQFRNDPEAHILLSSEVGSEGLDMQFCHSMVNYDLPWNPMVVEQRIGRIDRFGQQSPVVNIYNFVVKDSIQEDIYVRLLERIGIFRGTIGDMEAILDAEIEYEGKKVTIQELYSRLEKELFTNKLTQEERERKIGEVERAIENEKEEIKHLEEGLTDTLTNDSYFQDEIQRVLKKNAYVTEEELRNYLESIIRLELKQCTLNETEPGIYEFSMPMSDTTMLKRFIETYYRPKNETDNEMYRFKQQIKDKRVFKLTFSQQVAYDRRDVSFFSEKKMEMNGLPSYDLIVIEEASQAFLTTISAFISLGHRCLIVGDPMQLPPIAKTDNPLYNSWNVNTQLDGLTTFALGSKVKSYRIITTFRLTARSAAVTSLFYGNRFVSVKDDYIDYSMTKSQLFPNEGGVLFYPTGDMRNGVYSESADKIIHKVVSLLEKYYPNRSLAIITPFRATVTELQKRFAMSDSIIDITIETIDRIQGMTVDYAILYLPGRNPAFALEDKRFNVGTSRSLSTTLIVSDIPLDELRNFHTASPLVLKFMFRCDKVNINEQVELCESLPSVEEMPHNLVEEECKKEKLSAETAEQAAKSAIGLKIVGKIDLSKFERPKKEIVENKKNNDYPQSCDLL